ncbi:MAG TPA: carboxypeptidase regulatory-like domain-containing protein [Vicinamibacterales bacterium]
MTRTILRALAALAIVFAVGLAPAAAQTGQMFGELVGKITDDQGGALPGVTITLSGPAAMGSPTATTGPTGQYRFPAVNSGTYTLKFELAGFAPLVREGIVVPVRQTITVDGVMKLASLQETVTVSGASPTVDVENTKVGARLDQEILKNVPTSRTIFGSTTVLPGMTMARQDPGGLNAATSTNMVAHGATNYNLNYYGVTADTPQNYGSMYYMDFGSAEEISVDTAAMGAEVGGGGGANINVIPKSGGNTLKGSASWSITGKGYWDGFTGSNITSDLRAQGITDPTLRQLNDFNADVGGPFIKDKLWWFGSFRNYSTVEATPAYTVVNSDGSLTNPFDSNLRNYTASGKYQLNKNNQISAFWTYNRKFQPHRNAGVNQPNPINTLHQESPKNLINANWTSVMSQNTFLEVSSTYFHMHWPSTWADEFNALPAAQQFPSTLNVTSGIYMDGPEPTGERFRDAYRHQTNIGLTRYIDGFVGASHQLKTGFENWWTPTGTDGFVIQDDTRIRYTGSADTCNSTVRTGCTPSEAFLYNTPLTQLTKMRNFAAFVQDRVSYERVTLNLGLRWSYFDGSIPAQTGGGGKWFPVTSYPAIDPGYSWNTLAPRTGIVYKVTEDGKNVAKASYSRYYESMYTSEYASINPNSIQTSGVQTWSFLGDKNGNGKVDQNELGTLKSQFVPKANAIDPKLKDPKNDEIMVAFQRELANNWSLNVDWIQRWFRDMTTDQNCYGIPCDQVASTVYQPRTVQDFGPDNLKGTSDDRTLTLYDVKSQYVGKDTFFHTNCGNNVTVDCVDRYKAFELSVNKRMSNRWQMQASYVWSRLDGVQQGINTNSTTTRNVYDFTNPNNTVDLGAGPAGGRGANDQPQALKLLGSYQAKWDIVVGANFQSLVGLPIDRTLTVPFTQGSRNIGVDPRGTYRADTLNLLSLRADKGFRFGGQRRASVIAEVHNVMNSSAGQSQYGALTQGYANQAAFDAARITTSYFGRVQEIVAPRLLKIGFKFDF